MALTQQQLIDLGNTAGLTQAQVLAALSDNPGSTGIMTRSKRCATSSDCTECEDCTNAVRCIQCHDCSNIQDSYGCNYVEHAVNARQCNGQLNSASAYIYGCQDLQNCHHVILTDGLRDTSYVVCGISMASNTTQFDAIWAALTGGVV